MVFDEVVIVQPSLPAGEPARTAHLLRTVCVLSRTICYSLLFLQNACGQVPIETLLGVTLRGLELTQNQVNVIDDRNVP